MSDVRIRQTRLEDALAVATIHVRGWQAAYRGILPDAILDGLDVEGSAARHRERLEKPRRPGTCSWVLVEAEQPIGWVALGPCRDDDLPADALELYAIYLLPERVGTGLGRLLMEHCLGYGVAQGASEMVMWVLRGNARAQRFYAAAGFERDERVAEEPFEATGALKRRMVRRYRDA